MSANRLHITVVCTGNICRSPMGDVILNHAINQAGLTDQVRVDYAKNSLTLNLRAAVIVKNMGRK